MPRLPQISERLRDLPPNPSLLQLREALDVSLREIAIAVRFLNEALEEQQLPTIDLSKYALVDHVQGLDKIERGEAVDGDTLVWSDEFNKWVARPVAVDLGDITHIDFHRPEGIVRMTVEPVGGDEYTVELKKL